MRARLRLSSLIARSNMTPRTTAIGTTQPVTAKIFDPAQAIPPKTRMMRTSLLFPDRRLDISGTSSEGKLGHAHDEVKVHLVFPLRDRRNLTAWIYLPERFGLKPGCDTAVPGTCPTPVGAEAKASVPALR